MTNDMWNARHFGAHDKPRCANCGNRTFLARRSPASDHALHLERQTFACLECNLDFERVVGVRSGLVVRPHEPFVELALFLPLSQKRMSTHDKGRQQPS